MILRIFVRESHLSIPFPAKSKRLLIDPANKFEKLNNQCVNRAESYIVSYNPPPKKKREKERHHPGVGGNGLGVDKVSTRRYKKLFHRRQQNIDGRAILLEA